MTIPKELRYAKTHEWVRKEDNVVTVGITHHAQDALGDVVFVELPAVGSTFDAKESFGGVESVKAFSDIYAPVSGTVVALNDALEDEPELVNSEPYEGGWLLKMELSDSASFDVLLDAAAYDAYVHKD